MSILMRNMFLMRTLDLNPWGVYRQVSEFKK